jgi:hypothetical protein
MAAGDCHYGLFAAFVLGWEWSQSVIRTPRAVQRIADQIGATGPVTFGGRLDRSKATGLNSRWVATGPMAGDYRDWAAISALAQSIAAELQDQTASVTWQQSKPTSNPDQETMS